MNIYIKLFYISLFFIHFSESKAQTYLTNPSLEDTPADATMPSGWMAASKNTTPDILPGFWGVYLEPEDGETYIGLITREDGSYESIQQRLETQLERGSCYKMSLYLAHSDNYTGYNNKLKLRIWITTKKGKRQQLIYESPLIIEEEWQFYPIEFYPENNSSYLILEAYNGKGIKNQKANILIDAISNPQICNKV